MKEAISIFDEYEDRHHFDDLGIVVSISRKRERSDDLWGEVAILDATHDGFVFRRKMNLNANTTLKRTAREIGERLPDVDWQAILDHAFWRTVENWRHGEPLQLLDSGQPPIAPGHLLRPYISDTGVSILFGAGGSGKSIISLALAMSIASGRPIFDRAPEVVPVLYLDWEAERSDHHFRMVSIASAHQIPRPIENLYYRREWASLPTIADGIRSHVRERAIGLVVVDSLGGARGGAPESAEETIKVFEAMRSWGVPVLCVDHQSKTNLSSKEADIPFGSVYTVNMARLIWSIKTIKEEGSSRFSAIMTNTKANNDAIQRRHAIEYVIDRDTVSTSFTVRDLFGLPVDTEGLTNVERIKILLRDIGRPMAVAEIAEELDMTAGSLRSTLSRYSDAFVNVGSASQAKWVLRADREELPDAY